MKKTEKKKLVLSKETLKNLSEGEMKDVAGGKYPATIEMTCEPCSANVC